MLNNPIRPLRASAAATSTRLITAVATTPAVAISAAVSADPDSAT